MPPCHLVKKFSFGTWHKPAETFAQMKSRCISIVSRCFRSICPALKPREFIGCRLGDAGKCHQFVANPEGNAISRVKAGHC